MIGTTIAHYHILEKLGEGGMGVVYKAQDTKLNRYVALKFLPERVNTDETAKSRFIQEAQAAAGLNHPNICTIYGVEEFEEQLCMVMELVEGGTLAGKLPFPRTEDAVAVAIQIADALQEAHTKGIVHRDIKADNVMLSAKGQAKVMDFGLAKLKGAMKLTRTSSTVGTLGYMAPEQIQGGEVDHRSDIFSFGVLLFEMLTGKLAFRGEHEAAMLYSIVNEEPLNIAQLLPDLSPIVVNLIQRCLEKDPAERYQHFDDVTADLKRSQRKTSKVMRSSPGIAVDADAVRKVPADAELPPQRRSSVSRTIMIGLAVLALLAAGAAVWKFTRHSLPAIDPAMSTSVLQIPATEYQYPDMSADGKWLAFPGSDVNGKWDIYMMFIETGECRRLTSDSSSDLGNAATARFSLDGSSIVYGRIRPGTKVSEVCVVSVLTGTSRVVNDSGIAPTWGPKGDRIYFYRSGSNARSQSRSGWREYWSVTPQGTDARIEFIDSLMQGSLDYFTMKVSTDGNRMLFTRPMAGDYNEIFIRDLVTGTERQLTFDKKIIDEGIWADNGYVLYSSNRSGNFNIWAIPEQGGEPVQITRGGGPDYGISYSPAANRLIFSQRTETSTLWMVNTDGSGNRQLFPDDNIGRAHRSPNGRTLALQIMNSAYLDALMIRDLDGGRQEMLFPFNTNRGTGFPMWSPTGDQLAYSELRIVQDKRRVSAHVIDIAGGRRVSDLGEGIIIQWSSDSSVVILRNSSRDAKVLKFNESHLVQVKTGKDTLVFRDTTIATYVLNNSTLLFEDSQHDLRLLPLKEFVRDPSAAGVLILRGTDHDAVSATSTTLYYLTANRRQLRKMDLKSLEQTTVLEFAAGENVNLDEAGYTDDLVTYTKHRRKTNIVKIDKLFTE